MIVNWSQYINTVLCIQCYNDKPIVGRLYNIRNTIEGASHLHLVSEEDGCTWIVPMSNIRTMWELVFDNKPKVMDD